MSKIISSVFSSGNINTLLSTLVTSLSWWRPYQTVTVPSHREATSRYQIPERRKTFVRRGDGGNIYILEREMSPHTLHSASSQSIMLPIMRSISLRSRLEFLYFRPFCCLFRNDQFQVCLAQLAECRRRVVLTAGLEGTQTKESLLERHSFTGI